ILERSPWRWSSGWFVARGRPRKPRPLNYRAGDGAFLTREGCFSMFMGTVNLASTTMHLLHFLYTLMKLTMPPQTQSSKFHFPAFI
ncbi:unnamed protein product, partial [Musa banksii]